MNEIERARKNAQARRRDVLKSIEEVRGRLSLPQLADDALSILDPDLSFPRRIKTAVTSQPIAAALIFAGAAWLLSTTGDNTPGRSGRDRS